MSSLLFGWGVKAPTFGSLAAPLQQPPPAAVAVAKKGDKVAVAADKKKKKGSLGDAAANKVVITAAAGVIMDAIPTQSVTTAKLTDVNEDDDDEEETDKIMKEIRDASNVGGDVMGGGGRTSSHEKEDDDIIMEVEKTSDASDPILKAARDQAASLNRDALYSTYESNYTTLQNDRDDLRRQLVAKHDESKQQLEEYSHLKEEMEKLRTAVIQKEQEQNVLRGNVTSEKTTHSDTRHQLTCSNERIDRIEREGDNLRAEITRLTKSNEEYNTLLTSMTTQHSKSSSEALPLRLQVKRLEQELQAVTSHSNYLDGELSTKNEAIASLKQRHSGEVRTLRSELDTVQLTLEQRERDLSSARMMSEHTSRDIDRLQKKLYDREMEFNTQKELLENDINKERELVSLKDQRMVLAEDQRMSLLHEVEELKTLAKEASDEATTYANEAQLRLSEGVDRATRQVREEEERKREELEDRLQVVEEAKLRIEETILNKSTPRRRRQGDGGTSPLRITESGEESNSLMLLDDAASSGPLSLTDLYTRLASTEDELRAEQHENQKLKILIDRIHRDVAAKTPIFHQKQLELESALDELDVTAERLEYARREVTDVRSDNQDLVIQNKHMERECNELKGENVDLATQVQSLLQRRAVEQDDVISFTDITSLQQQNQKLVRDYHSMSSKISELEEKIKNNPDEIELNSLRNEVGSLREEREKQAKLVAGIVHQRDLYRALVAKNDALAIEGGGGSGAVVDQLALADTRAEQLPLIEAKNYDLIEEVAKLKAELSCGKHEQEALQGRLARVDAHANELTTSNERLRGDLTTAKATAARLEIDVSHYQGKTERLENSVNMLKSENESESRRKAQLEELLNKTQAHLDTVRGELAKKEQQYQQVSSKMRLIEVQLETSTANEKRMESEASALHAEIARQETLLSSVQRIEASLTAKSEGELEILQEDVKRLQESKSDDATKHAAVVQKLEGKIAELELSVKDLTAQKEAATVNATKAALECSKLKLKVQELTLKLKTSEKVSSKLGFLYAIPIRVEL